jgi:hypothetical protein
MINYDLIYATLAQLVEHSFRKAGVRSSILRGGSRNEVRQLAHPMRA